MGLVSSAGVDLRDLSVAHGPGPVDPDLPSPAKRLRTGGHVTSPEAVELTGATYRQIDYWVRTGKVGRHLRGLGSGARRRYHATDIEVLSALAQLSALGCRDDRMATAADAVAVRRVAPAGERLVVLLDGTTYRHPIDQPVAAAGPLWQVTLRSFGGAQC